MEKQYSAVPLHVQISADYNRITAMTEHMGKLYIALDQLRVYPINITLSGNQEITAECLKGKSISLEGHEIYDLQSVGDQLIVLCRSGPKEPGVIFTIPSDGTQSASLTDGEAAHTMAVNKFTDKKAIAIAIGKSVEVKSYEDGQWNNIFARQFQTKVISVALSYPKMCVLTEDYTYVLHCQQPDNDAEFKSRNEESAITIPASVQGRSMHYYFKYISKLSTILDEKISSNVNGMAFQSLQIAHAHYKNLYASISTTEATVYNFANNRDKTQGIATLNNLSHVCSFQDSVFIVSTTKDIFALTDCTSAFKLLAEGNVLDAISSLPNSSVDLIAGVFEQLWIMNNNQQAISMIKAPETIPLLRNILALFKFLTFDDDFKNIRLTNCVETDDSKITRQLGESLAYVLANFHIDESTRRYVETALFEIYCYLEDIPKLSAYLNEVRLLSDNSIKLFFQQNKSAGEPIYLGYLGQFDEAMEQFKALKEYDEIILDCIVNVIIKNAKNWKFIKTHFAWLLGHSPIHACRVLTCDKVQPHKSLRFCTKHHSAYFPRVLHDVLNHKDLMGRSDRVKDYTNQICQLLLHLHDSDFDKHKVAFCTCMINDPKSSIEDIEQELGDDCIEVIKKYKDDIDPTTLLSFVDQIQIRRVKVEIYRATGKVEEAISLIWGTENDAPDIEGCEQFCQENDDPAVAFEILIQLIKNRLPASEQMPQLMKLLSRNMSAIDISNALANINPDLPLEEVAHFLESSYRRLIAMRKDMALDAAFAKSNEFENHYERVILESKCVTLDSTTVCTGCHSPLGYTFVQRAPNGSLYHFNCLPSKPPVNDSQ